MERFRHTRIKDVAINDADPDDGNKWKCIACGLPIFATRFVDDPNHMQGQPLRSVRGHMHDQCANKFPAKLEEHPLHPMADLILHVQDDIKTHEFCSRCGSKCGSKFYKCMGEYCGFTLDLLCASPITIVHQSHGHELTATRGSSCSFICSACGTQHDDGPALGKWSVSYVCSPCDFWIHPDCAVLPSAIVVDDKVIVHDHPLLLSYANEDELWRAIGIWGTFRANKCAICRGYSKGSGWYRCFHCDYSAHIKCVVYSNALQSFKQVLLRDAKVPGLIHLPMADEHQSVIQSIMNSIGTIGCDNNDERVDIKVHQHPLVINHLRDDDDDDDVLVCNACVQIISPSDAFYSCSRSKVNKSCTNFFLHSCCARLPATTTTRRCSHKYEEHTVSLKVGKYPFYQLHYRLATKRYRQNGFLYLCEECDEYMDVTTALMPASITHDAHAKSHILCVTSRRDLICSCCKTYDHQIGYECNNCNNFFIHIDCALLPYKVRHDFDQHPLNLITTSNSLHHYHQEEEEEEVPLCEICEGNLDTRPWFYGCKKCDQSFHVGCIPYFDYLSKIKFGFTIRVKLHGCPLACVRALSVDGYRCGHCNGVIRESDQIAFECVECDYRIHEWCAKKKLLKG